MKILNYSLFDMLRTFKCLSSPNTRISFHHRRLSRKKYTERNENQEGKQMRSFLIFIIIYVPYLFICWTKLSDMPCSTVTSIQNFVYLFSLAIFSFCSSCFIWCSAELDLICNIKKISKKLNRTLKMYGVRISALDILLKQLNILF